MNPTVVLSIAGTDSGGAAGLAADLATFAAHGTHGTCVVSAVTAQDTTGVHAVHVPPLDVVAAQINAVLDDLPVAAVKTGMLGSPEVVRLVAERVGHLPLVVDPVLVATSGAVLGDEAVRSAYVTHLLPVATVITPNADEARALLGVVGEADELAARLAASGPAVVVTGGFEPFETPRSSAPQEPMLAGARSSTTEGVAGGFEPFETPRTSAPQEPTLAGARSSTGGFETLAGARSSTTVGAGRCTDWLAVPGEDPVALTHPAVPTSNDHGTGCTFSAALAALIAREFPLPSAVRRAAAYTSHQLALSRRWDLGRGRGPIAHLIPTHHEETP